MTIPPPPTPNHILRGHSASLTALSFSDDNERLYSGDVSGLVVVTSTSSLRAIASWKAHTDGLLGIEEWGNRIITHARDNKIHVWIRIVELPSSARLGGSATQPGLPVPTLCYSMDVNALNFCRFSLLKLSPSRVSDDDGGHRALIALPNLIDSSVADVWELPSSDRIHAAIGLDGSGKSVFSSESNERPKTGIIMSLHLFTVPREQSQPSSSSECTDELRLLCAYENGGVTLRRYARPDKRKSVEGVGWEVVWAVKLHVESVMAMKVSRTNNIALTVSADHLIGRYDLLKPIDMPPDTACVAHRTKYPGNSSIAIRDDGKVCAVGGWDGHIRLYATRTMKPLGALKYHKTGCQALEFARTIDEVTEKPVETYDDDSGDEMSENQKTARARWLVCGGKDNRISVWSLISFTKT